MFTRVAASVCRPTTVRSISLSVSSFSFTSSLSSSHFSSPLCSIPSLFSPCPSRSFVSSFPRFDANLYEVTKAGPLRRADFPPGYTGKQHTGVTGLDVIPNAKEVLIGLYEETINVAKHYGSNSYNDTIIKLCNYRLRLVLENETNEQIEDAIAAGQIEELVEQAEDELDLLVTMNEEFRPWEPDPEDEAHFAATDYPMYGETPESHDLTLDDSCWEEIDKKLGYGKDGKKLPVAEEKKA